MKLFILNLFLLLTGNELDLKRVEAGSSAKDIIETYSAKEPIEEYSAKSSKDCLVELPAPLPDVLMDRLEMPIYSYLPLPPIKPRLVTDVNP